MVSDNYGTERGSAGSIFATFTFEIGTHQQNSRSDGKRRLCDSSIICVGSSSSAHGIVMRRSTRRCALRFCVEVVTENNESCSLFRGFGYKLYNAIQACFEIKDTNARIREAGIVFDDSPADITRNYKGAANG